MSSAWHHPSALRASVGPPFAIAEPVVLPMPSPKRNTARIIENVYVVWPSERPRRRVHTTSDASAVSPERPIVMYTHFAPGAAVTETGSLPSDSFGGAYGDFLARARAVSATATLKTT